MRARFASLVSVLALGTLVGCSDDATQPTPGVEVDTGIADTGTPPRDSTVSDTGMPEDTNPEDTGSPADTADTSTGDVADGADATDTATTDATDAADTTTTDATDTAVPDAADTATDDAADAADSAVADSGDAVADSGDAGPTLPSAEVWVTRVGDGSAGLTSASTAVFIDKFQLSTLAHLGTIPMPTTVSGSNNPLTFSGSATSEGALARSLNGGYVTLAGYAVGPGTASVVGTPTTGDAGTVVLRVIGRVSAAGAVDTSTTTTSYTGNNIRAAVTTDGSAYWIAGNTSGLSYLPHGASAAAATLISTGLTNVRVATLVEDGALWGSTGSGSTYRAFNFGTTPRPTVATTPVAPPGLPTTGSPYGVAGIATGTTTDVDTVYVCDDSSGSGGGIYRYKATGGTFATGVQITSTLCRGLAVMKSGSSVIVVAVTGENPSRVVAGVDTLVGLPTLVTAPVATAATNTQFRGAAFAPM